MQNPVPVQTKNFRNPKKGMIVTALAGPGSNLLMAFVLFVFYYIVFASSAKSCCKALSHISLILPQQSMFLLQYSIFFRFRRLTAQRLSVFLILEQNIF